VICLSIAEKINTVQPIRVCGVSDIDMLITELDPGNSLLKTFVDAGVRVL
jgi:DeoR/GlpR family transcriptional regulator of sugar metabolism